MIKANLKLINADLLFFGLTFRKFHIVRWISASTRMVRCSILKIGRLLPYLDLLLVCLYSSELGNSEYFSLSWKKGCRLLERSDSASYRFQ